MSVHHAVNAAITAAATATPYAAALQDFTMLFIDRYAAACARRAPRAAARAFMMRARARRADSIYACYGLAGGVQRAVQAAMIDVARLRCMRRGERWRATRIRVRAAHELCLCLRRARMRCALCARRYAQRRQRVLAARSRGVRRHNVILLADSGAREAARRLRHAVSRRRRQRRCFTRISTAREI